MSNEMGFIRTLWKRAMLRKIQFSDAHGRLELLYRLRDPWGMESPREQYRFQETNAFLQQRLGVVESLLEVGCGEGHQTEALLQVARNVVGIDVSSTAIQRARARVPGATFIVGDVLEAPDLSPPRRFDVVTACEILYYVKDVTPYTKTLERLGRHIAATYVDKYKERLDPIVAGKPGVEIGRIEFEQTGWTMAIWRGEPNESSRAVKPDGSDPSRDRRG